MIRRPPRSTQGVSSAASDVYKRQSFYIMFAFVELAAAAFFGDFEVAVIVAVFSLFNCATAYARLHVRDQDLYNEAAATKTSNLQYILGALGLALVAGMLMR